MLNKLSLISVVAACFFIPTSGFADYVRHFGGHVRYGRGHFAGVQHFVGVGNTSRNRRALYYVPDKAPPNTGSKSYAPILGHAYTSPPPKPAPSYPPNWPPPWRRCPGEVPTVYGCVH